MEEILKRYMKNAKLVNEHPESPKFEHYIAKIENELLEWVLED